MFVIKPGMGMNGESFGNGYIVVGVRDPLLAQSLLRGWTASEILRSPSSWSSLGQTLCEHYTPERVAVIKECQQVLAPVILLLPLPDEHLKMELLYHVVEKSPERSNDP